MECSVQTNEAPKKTHYPLFICYSYTANYYYDAQNRECNWKMQKLIFFMIQKLIWNSEAKEKKTIKLHYF